VAAVKFRGALTALELMASQMTATAPPALLAGAVLVPVPAHPARRRARGHDHVRRLAEGVGARTGLLVAPCLRRTGPATRQLGARRRDRRAPGRVGVEAAGPAPAVALLLDDVHTTGATLAACAWALRGAGAREVRALTYARTLRGKGPAPDRAG
jgi:predicted amidophosphoribosyltransferase